MKKYLLLFVVFLFGFVGCKKTDDKQEIVEKVVAKTQLLDDCNQSAAILLKATGTFFCEEPNKELYYLTFTKQHVINTQTYNDMVEAFYGTNILPETEINWSQIDSLLSDHCYLKYLSFNFDANDISNNDITLKLVDDFDCNNPCYSIPFLRSIIAKNKLDEKTTKFYFSKAKNSKGRPTVIFKVNNNAFYGFYDMTEIPKSIIKLLDESLAIKLKGKK